MNSLRDIVDSSPKLRSIETNAMQELRGEDAPQPLAPARWDWNEVQRVLLVRLRSIGDTVLATPCLTALKRFLPNVEIDVLVEDWVRPVLDQHPLINRVVVLERGSLASRARVAREMRSTGYDVVYNLHGGTTATLLTRATGAQHRVGYKSYQYAQLHNHQAPSPLLLWGQAKTHSVEQQLALLGWTGIPVTDRPRTRLSITTDAASAIEQMIQNSGLSGRDLALVHPAAAFATKQWSTENFARTIGFLKQRGFSCIAITSPAERNLLEHLKRLCPENLTTFDSLSLPEVSALLSRCKIFVGNDSGIAHIASAVETPAVVVFGSSNIAHWQPWNSAPAEVVFEEMPCQPCHGYFCEKFPQPECILRVPVDRVCAAIDRVLNSL